MSDPFQADRFEPLIGRHFATEGGPEPFTLVEVARPGIRGTEGNRGGRDPFILIFRGPPSPILPEGERTFKVDGIADVTFQVMPIHTVSREQQDYQAVFN